MPLRFEAKTHIGDAIIGVQDDQIMVYFPDGEGTSEPLSALTIQKLKAIVLSAQLHHSEANAEANTP